MDQIDIILNQQAIKQKIRGVTYDFPIKTDGIWGTDLQHIHNYLMDYETYILTINTNCEQIILPIHDKQLNRKYKYLLLKSVNIAAIKRAI